MTMIETSFARAPVPLGMQPVPASGESGLRDAEGVKVDGDGLSIAELEKFLLDIRDEPEWRMLANRCADYYDHNQLDDEVLADFRKMGLPPLVINLIHPTINTVLGMEAKTRTDWQVTFDDERFEQVSLALGKKMSEAERMSQADRAISNAYGGQIKSGLHWVEVGTNPNPFAYRYRVRDVHRREIWWDWRMREIEEWRYLVRKRRYDADQLRMAFPKFRDMIEAAVEGGTTWQEYAMRLDDGTGLGQFIDIERALTFDQQRWVDCNRRQLDVFEVWYRKFVRGYVARLGDTVIEIDQKNPRHMLAIANGVMKPMLATYPKLRQAIYIGPQRVIDRPTPLPHRKIPYVPFFGYREDLTGAPYGLIRGMLSSQDEINSRRSKMRAMLNARRGIVDADALDEAVNTHEDVADELSRHDSYIVTNPNRRNVEGVKIADNADLSQGQAQVLSESKDEIHETSGVFPPMAGDQRGGLSGLAINSLVEQGTQTLAEINDNYTWARREVGDHLIEFVKADSMHEHSVVVGETKQSRRSIELNKQQWDPIMGEMTRVNDVSTSSVKVVLDDVPSTPAWRQQQSAHLAEITKSLPPQLQAFVVPFYLEATDLRDRKKIAAMLRKQLNMPDPDAPDQGQQEQQVPPEVQQQLQQATDAANALQEQLQKVTDENKQLKLVNANKSHELDLKASAAAAKASTDQHRADTDRMAAEEKARNDRLTTFATVERAEYPKGGAPATEPQLHDAIQGTLDEVLATMREGLQEFHGRLAQIEKHVGKTPAPAAPAAAAQPAQPAPTPLALGPIHVHQPPAPTKPRRKKITMQTPHGPVTATIEPDPEDPNEATEGPNDTGPEPAPPKGQQ